MSIKSLKLKNALESHGWSDVEVHWTAISSPLEMCGQAGGWMAMIPGYGVEPLGLNFPEALNHVHNSSWLHNKNNS